MKTPKEDLAFFSDTLPFLLSLAEYFATITVVASDIFESSFNELTSLIYIMGNSCSEVFVELVEVSLVKVDVNHCRLNTFEDWNWQNSTIEFNLRTCAVC